MVRMNLMDPMPTVGNLYAYGSKIVMNGMTWVSIEVRTASWLKGTTDGEYQVRLVKGYYITQFN